MNIKAIYVIIILLSAILFISCKSHEPKQYQYYPLQRVGAARSVIHIYDTISTFPAVDSLYRECYTSGGRGRVERSDEASAVSPAKQCRHIVIKAQSDDTTTVAPLSPSVRIHSNPIPIQDFQDPSALSIITYIIYKHPIFFIIVVVSMSIMLKLVFKRGHN